MISDDDKMHWQIDRTNFYLKVYFQIKDKYRFSLKVVRVNISRFWFFAMQKYAKLTNLTGILVNTNYIYHNSVMRIAGVDQYLESGNIIAASLWAPSFVAMSPRNSL